MPVWRLQCSWGADTPFPRDRVIFTPHFNSGSIIQDADALCEDLATALDAWDGGARQLEVTAYDAQGTPPVFPQGSAIRNQDQFGVTTGVREVAICLSFYSNLNRPRHRGRLYIPCSLAAIGTSATRPSAANMQKVADLAPIFANLGGTDVDWCVYSRVDDTARSITNWWVDDAWDIQRSRGLQPTSRIQGTVGEA